jgi:hypothetical protein
MSFRITNKIVNIQKAPRRLLEKGIRENTFNGFRSI